MDAGLESLIDLHVFSPGRRLFALMQIHEIAKERNETGLLPLLDEAIAAERRNIELIASYHADQKKKKGSSEAQAIDRKIDRNLGAIQDVAKAVLKTEEPSEPRYQRAEEMLGAFFPLGILSVTLLPYVEELAQVERILDLARGVYKHTVAEVGVEQFLHNLASLATEFRETLEANRPEGIAYDSVRSSAARCQNLLLQVAAYVIGHHHADTDEEAKAREELLRPILIQNEEIYEHLRARRSIPDVDPKTGEELPPGTSPSPAPPVSGTV